MNSTPVSLKSTDEGRESLDIEVELDHGRRVVRLHMLEFDEGPVASYLLNGLSTDFGVRVDDSGPAHLLTLPRYAVVIVLAGRHHPARIQQDVAGRTSLRLGDPDADYLGRCRAAIAELLQSVDGLDVDAVVVGADRYGRPEPNEGFLHLLHDLDDEARQDELHELCRRVGQKHDVSIIEMRFVLPCIDLKYAIANERHFAWNPLARRVVLRNWERG